MNIRINEIDVRLRFSYSLLRALSKKWGIHNIEDLFTKILKAFENAESNAFDAIDVVSEIVVESARLSGQELSIVDVSDFMFENPNLIAGIIHEFINSMPQPEAEGTDPKKK